MKKTIEERIKKLEKSDKWTLILLVLITICLACLTTITLNLWLKIQEYTPIQIWLKFHDSYSIPHRIDKADRFKNLLAYLKIKNKQSFVYLGRFLSLISLVKLWNQR